MGRWLEDADLARAYLVSDESFGLDDVEGLLRWSEATEMVEAWAIDHRDGGLVATSNTKPDFPWLSVYECEVTLSPDLPKGRGYGFEAHQLVVDHIFRSYEQASKVMGRAADFNGAAIAIMRKLGAVQEGCLRRHAELGGKHHDIVFYGLLREEWERTGAAERRFPLPVGSCLPAAGRSSAPGS